MQHFPSPIFIPPPPLLLPPPPISTTDTTFEHLLTQKLKLDSASSYIHDVYIPFVIPWEQWPCIQTQEGMGAFGKPRDANIKIDQGSRQLVQVGELDARIIKGELHSETVIPLMGQANGASRAGMMPFGAYRSNISTIIDNHGFDTSKLKLSESVIPKQMQGSIPPRNGETLMGSLRNQTMNVKYLHYMSESCAPESHAFISRQFAPTSTEMAGSSIIDRRRNGYGENLGKFEPASEAIVPLLFHTQDIYQRSGADFGAFRPVISDSEGGYKMTLDEERLCKLVVPYQTAPSLT
uniref:Uncharacterized protein n=1 Tax=Parascaris equorum TaxID=6256 RepID=A0A914RNE9_PAREQ